MAIKIFGKTLITVYNHYYYRLSLGSLKPLREERLKCFAITDESDIHISSALRKMLREQPEYIKGYGFNDSSGNTVGHLFLIKKGGTEVLYKIRNIDAYVFAVRVFENYRGQGYAGEMITWLAGLLKGENIETLYLTVKKSNQSAIRAYEKLGFERIGERRFVRIWRYNIPYLTL